MTGCLASMDPGSAVRGQGHPGQVLAYSVPASSAAWWWAAGGVAFGPTGHAGESTDGSLTVRDGTRTTALTPSPLTWPKGPGQGKRESLPRPTHTEEDRRVAEP